MKKTMVGPESRYAKALFDLALETDLKAVSSSLASLSQAMTDSSDLSEVLGTSAVTETEKRALLTALLSELKAPKEVLNFVHVLADKNRTNLLGGILSEFSRLVEVHQGVTRATVTSAAALTDIQREAIFSFVEKKMTGTKEIVLDEYVDESLMAGVQVRIGDMQYDASVKGRLNGLRHSLLS